MCRRIPLWLAAVLGAGLLPSWAWGLVINAYNSVVNDRFSPGYPASLVENSSFAYSTYDWSGVGWLSSDGNRSYALLGPRHVLYAAHYAPTVSALLNFYSTDDQLKGYVVQSESGSLWGDLAVGTLTAPIPAGDNVEPCTILFLGYDYSKYTGSTTDHNLLMYGFTARVGWNWIEQAVYFNDDPTQALYFQYLYDTTSAGRASLEGGDSGSPSFIVYDGRTYLAGAHYAHDFANQFDYDTALPLMLSTVSNYMALTGYLPNVYTPPTAQWVGTTGAWVVDSNWSPVGSSPKITSDTITDGMVTRCASMLFKDNVGTHSVITPPGGATVTGLTFSALDGTGFTFSGGTLTIGEAGINNSDGSTHQSRQQVFNCPITLRASQRWTTGSGGLSVTGALSTGNIAGAGMGYLLVIEGPGNTTISGPISGTGALAKDGAGTLTLSSTGGNSYSGKTFIHGGTLAIGRDNHLGTAPAALVADQLTIDGGALQATGAAPFALSASRGITLGGAGGTIQVDSGQILTVSAPITGGGSLTKALPGALVLAGGNSYTGGTILSAGTLRLGNSAALGGPTARLSISGGTLDLGNYGLTLAAFSGAAGAVTSSGAAGVSTLTLNLAPGSSAYGGSIGDGGSRTLAVSKVGAGTLALSGDNAYSGPTTVAGGVLVVSGAGGRIAHSSAYNLNGGTLRVDNSGGATPSGNRLSAAAPLNLRLGTFQVIANSATHETLGAVNALAGDNTYAMTVVAGSTVANATLSRAPGATINFTSTGGDFSAGSRIVFSGLAPGFVNPGAFVNGTNYAVYDAGAFVRALNYTGDGNAVSVGAGANIGANAGKDVQVTGAITAQPSIGIHTLKFSGANAFTLAAGATLTLTGGGLLKTDTGAAAIGNGTAIQAGFNQELVVRTNLSNDSLTIYTPIAANGVNALTKSGPGTLVLASTSNAYTGGTTVDGGTLVVSSDANLGAIPASSQVNITLNGGTLAYYVPFSLNASRTISLGVANTAGTIHTNGYNVTIASQITGPGILKKVGAGTLTLTGSNTHTGGTAVSGGTLQLGNVLALGSTAGALSLSFNTTLDLNTFSPTVGALSGPGGLITDSGAAGTSTLTVNLVSGSSAFAGAINNGAARTLALTKDGSGTLTLSGASSYSGPTTISGGTLVLSGVNGTIVQSTAYNVTGGMIELDNSAGNTSSQNRLRDSSPLNLRAGTLHFVGRYTDSETLGAVNVLAGENTFGVTVLVSTPIITNALLYRAAGATINFVGTGDPLDYNTSDNYTRIVFTGRSGGFFDQGTFVNGTDYAVYDTTTIVDPVAYPFLRAMAQGDDVNNDWTGSFADSFPVSRHVKLSAAASSGSVAAVKTLNLAGNFIVTLNNPLTLSSGGILKSGGGAGTINDGSLHNGSLTTSVGVELVIRTDSAADVLTIQSPILSSSTGGLTKSGQGTLIIPVGTLNQYSGGTWINAGTLSVAADANLGATLPSPAVNITLDGGTLLYGGFFALNANRTINLSLANVAGTIDTGSYAVTVASQITGPGNLVKAGSDILTLSGGNNYSGATTVAAGTLRLAGASALGAAAAGTTVAAGAVLDLYGQTGVAEPLTIHGSGIAAGGALVNSGPTLAGLTGPVTLGSDASIGGSADLTLGGSLSYGNSTLTKAGSGALILTGTQTFGSGAAVTVESGTLRYNLAADDTTVGGNNTVTISGGTLELAGGNSALSDGNGGYVNVVNNSSAGLSVLAGANQVTGAITGTGSTVVQAGATLTAASIVQDVVTIAMGSRGSGAVLASGMGNPTLPLGTVVGGLSAAGGTEALTLAQDPSGGSLTTLAPADASQPWLGGTAIAGGVDPVPEPASLLMLATLAACLVGYGWRRRARR